MKKKQKKKSFGNRINKTVTVVQLAVTAIIAAITVYKMIPKAEKIKGVDTDVLIDTYTYKEEAEATEGVDVAEAPVEEC